MFDLGLIIPNSYIPCLHKRTKLRGAPQDKTLVTFIDHHNPQDTQDLPNPKYLALHAAIAGIIHTSGAVEAIDEMIQAAESVHVFAADGSTSTNGLFMAHSAHKVCHVFNIFAGS